MAEALSPTIKLRERGGGGPFSPTPKSPFLLGSNDDKLERAQARAARAAAIRRKPTTAPPPASNSDRYLGKEQIYELLQNCIKLASENKITQKNTWELNLIDHLGDIIKVEEENDTETNFQKASCTLEAGVKIYSMRVDSVHSEAYKVLGGINRVGQENEQDHVVEDNNTDGGQEEGHTKKDDRKLSPLSTLESSFEALNVKKFDVAFAVDPLYHQTTAQFDEGGAKGLLLNNLGVYGNCQVLFDSSEIPGKCMSSSTQHDKAETIDLSFARECIEEMVLHIPKKQEISPSLRDIVNQFDKDNRRPSEAYYPEQSSEQTFETDEHGPEYNDGAFKNLGTWDMEPDDGPSILDENTYGIDPVLPGQHDEDETFSYRDPDEDGRFESIDGCLFLNLGFSKTQNAWAGPDHWKFRKFKESPPEEKEVPTKKSKSKMAELDIDFIKSLDTDVSHIFAPPKNPRSLLLPANRALCKTTLPEDCHYQPENLVKLFLRPNDTCLGKKLRKAADEEIQEGDDIGENPSWDDENGFGGTFDDGNAFSDVEESSMLVSQPRQVNKIEVQYDKTSKQVDVQALKETLWDRIQGLNMASVQENDEGGKVSFKEVLSTYPNDGRAAASPSDISPHLCFICLLHLANEHGLQLQGSSNLDDLSIILQSPNGMALTS